MGANTLGAPDFDNLHDFDWPWRIELGPDWLDVDLKDQFMIVDPLPTT